MQGAVHKGLKIGFGWSVNAAVIGGVFAQGRNPGRSFVYIACATLFVVVYEKHCGRTAALLLVAETGRQALYDRVRMVVMDDNKDEIERLFMLQAAGSLTAVLF
jgi:hypothetical protein